MQLQLILPGIEFEDSYRTYIRELGNEERYPFPLDFEYHDFQALLRRIESLRSGTTVPDGLVPSTTYWLIQRGQLVGVSNLRHHLNDRIRHAGGHIGLGIRPSVRCRGLGRTLLALTIVEAAKRGIDVVHVHCHKHNQPSARMIIAAGGRLDSEIQQSGSVIQRYLISSDVGSTGGIVA